MNHSPPLSICPLELELESLDLELTTFSGPLWRSALGMALHAHFPGVFPLLFGPEARMGRLYALAPAFARLDPGERATLHITLFGPACAHAVACVQAIARQGESGLGEKRGKYRLLSARVAGQPAFFNADMGLLAWPQGIDAAPLFNGATPCSLVEISLATPLRIKQEGEPLCEPIAFETLIKRSLGRVAQLCEAAQIANPIDRQLALEMQLSAAGVPIAGSTLNPVSISHTSARSQQRMTFDGVDGWLRYEGQISAAQHGLLKLAELTQLGGKTAFGFGRIRVRSQ